MSVVELDMRTAAERKLETIEKKLPLDAINPAHESFLRVNSPSHGIFSFTSTQLYLYVNRFLKQIAVELELSLNVLSFKPA